MIWRLAFRHLIAKPFSAVLTIVAIAACISLLGIFWSVIENLEQVQITQSQLQGNPNSVPAVTVFMDSKLSKNQVDQFKADILKQKEFKSVDVIAPDDALKLFEQQFGETLSKALTQSTLPLTLKIHFSDTNVSRERYAQLLNDIRSTEGVLDLDDGVSLVPTTDTKLESKVFTWATALLVLVFSVVSLLVSHLIRIAFESTRSEVETMKILGAPFSWMFLPLILEGLVFGFIGTFMALLCVSGTVKFLIPKFASVLLPKGISFFALSWASTLQLMAVGILASLIGACLTWPLVKQPPSEV